MKNFKRYEFDAFNTNHSIENAIVIVSKQYPRLRMNRKINEVTNDGRCVNYLYIESTGSVNIDSNIADLVSQCGGFIGSSSVCDSSTI